MNLSSATFAAKLTQKRISCRLRRKTKRNYSVTNKEITETTVVSLLSYAAFGKQFLQTQWNYKYVKQSSPFVIVPKKNYKYK